MKNKIFQSIILTALITLVLSCASTDGKKRYKVFDDFIVENQLTSLSKIRTFKMINWSALDDKHVMLSSHHNKKYIITLSSYCPGLDRVNSIALKQSMDFSLSAKFDSIIVVDQQKQECSIYKIHELTKQQAKDVLKLR